MKFDIVRAWKDEAYRQGLSDEQRNQLPANPAGELTDAEMELVYGGGGGGGAPIMTPAAPAVQHVYHAPHVVHHVTAVGVSSAAASSVTRVHSFGVLCDVSIFSANVLTVPILPIASPISQCCSNWD